MIARIVVAITVVKNLMAHSDTIMLNAAQQNMAANSSCLMPISTTIALSLATASDNRMSSWPVTIKVYEWKRH